MWPVQPISHRLGCNISGDVCPGHSEATVPTDSSTLCVDSFPPFEAVLGAKVIGRVEQIASPS